MSRWVERDADFINRRLGLPCHSEILSTRGQDRKQIMLGTGPKQLVSKSLLVQAPLVKRTRVTLIFLDRSAFRLNTLKVTLARLFPRGIS